MTQSHLSTAIVIAKEPIAGRVKTRLTPPLTADEAAGIAAAALADTLRAIDAVPARRRLLVFDGDATRWTPSGWSVAAQPAGGLDVRLAAAFAAAPAGPAVLVGMDTPQLRPGHLLDWRPDRYDACLGLATDGGFWAIGFADPRCAAEAIPGVPMSSEHTGAEQLVRLQALGLQVQLLRRLTDVDTADSAAEVARLAPDTEFSQTYAKYSAVMR